MYACLDNLAHHQIARMWDMSICKHMASVQADFHLQYSLPFLCQIGPELCELGINLNPCPCATNVRLQIVNNRSLFRDITPVSDYGKIAQIVVVASEKEAELETKDMGQ